MVEQKECFTDGKIDMKKMKLKLKTNKLDIEYLNQLLKPDNEFVLEDTDLFENDVVGK
jgi:hypothetical protein